MVSLLHSCLDVLPFSGTALDMLYNPEQSGERRHVCFVKGDTFSVLVAALPSLEQCGHFPGEITWRGRLSGACKSKAAARGRARPWLSCSGCTGEWPAGSSHFALMPRAPCCAEKSSGLGGLHSPHMPTDWSSLNTSSHTWPLRSPRPTVHLWWDTYQSTCFCWASGSLTLLCSLASSPTGMQGHWKLSTGGTALVVEALTHQLWLSSH